MFGFILLAYIGQTDQMSLLLLLENEPNNPSHYFYIRKCMEAQGIVDGTVRSNIRDLAHTFPYSMLHFVSLGGSS